MVNQSAQLEYLIARMVSSGPRVRHKYAFWFPLPYSVLKVMYGDILRRLDSGECPVCGKTFRSRQVVSAHLFKYHKEFVAEIITSTIERYLLILSNMRHVGNSIVLKVNGKDLKFKTRRQLAEYIQRNPEVLELLGNGGG